MGLPRWVPLGLGNLTWERGLGKLGPSYGPRKPLKPAQKWGTVAAQASGGGTQDQQPPPRWMDPDKPQKAQEHGPTIPYSICQRNFYTLSQAQGQAGSWCRTLLQP